MPISSHDVLNARGMHARKPCACRGKAKGILGRFVDALSTQPSPFKSQSYSISGVSDAVDGDRPPTILSSSGITQMYEDDLHPAIRNMTSETSDSIYAETFNYLLNKTIVDTEYLGDVLAGTSDPSGFPSTRLGNQLKQVAKIMKQRSVLGNEREVFFTESYGFDTHFTLNYGTLFGDVDNAVNAFKNFLKTEGLWDDVVIISSSDFGRSLVPNNGGTDHAWGGNYFMMGGDVKGGQILGQFPRRLDPYLSEESISSNGRLLPTTSWDQVWNGIVDWFGVIDDKKEEVLPNIANFPSESRFTRDMMFKSSS